MGIDTSSVMNGLKSAMQTTSSFLPQPLASGVSFASQLIPQQPGQVVDISPSYQALIEQQMQIQMEQQNVTFASNIEKSRHESKMAAVRNIRVG